MAAWTGRSSRAWVRVELVARSTSLPDLEAARRDFEQALGEDLALVGGGTLEERVLELLGQSGGTLAVAESMTGGTIQARLTGIPGSSSAFRGGAVVYSADAKHRLAEVEPGLILQEGTVSEPVTRALAEGHRPEAGNGLGPGGHRQRGPHRGQGGARPRRDLLHRRARPRRHHLPDPELSRQPDGYPGPHRHLGPGPPEATDPGVPIPERMR